MNPLYLSDFPIKGFFAAFFDDSDIDAVNQPKDKDAPKSKGQYEKHRMLFYHLFFDMYYSEADVPPVCGFAASADTTYQTNPVLRASLPVSKDGKPEQSFLSQTIKDETSFRSAGALSYISGFLSHNNYEQFFLYLYRMDALWNGRLTPSGYAHLHYLQDAFRLKKMSSVMQDICGAFFSRDEDGSSALDRCFQDLYALSDTDEPEAYFRYIELFYKVKKPSYAYALIVLWAVINVHALYFLPAISQIILYKEEPTTELDENKRYIIKSVINDNLYLSAISTLEPLSASEKNYTVRELLYSVNAGQFHRPLSIFEFIKCADFDGLNPSTKPEETPKIDGIFNPKETKRFLTRLIDRYKDLFTKKTTANLRSQVTGMFSRKTEPYYITIDGKFLTYEGWFSDTRITLREQEYRDATSRWCFTESPNSIAIFNAGFWVNIFALDIPNGAQFAKTLLWCFPAFSQKAQRFTVHEVIEWADRKAEIDEKHAEERKNAKRGKG